MREMKIKSLLISIELGVMVKQVADWCRTISAGAFILGFLNPAMLGNNILINKAIWVVGIPGLCLCLLLSVAGSKFETWKKGI
jgi:hypothetical protein